MLEKFNKLNMKLQIIVGEPKVTAVDLGKSTWSSNPFGSKVFANDCPHQRTWPARIKAQGRHFEHSID